MINLEKEVSPKELYPTESFVFIENRLLQFYCCIYEQNMDISKAKVFYYDGEYYIYQGHHLVLAAIMSNKEKIVVDIVPVEEVEFAKNSLDFENTIKSVGKRTLYDFETIGNFRYKSYPKYY